MSKTTDLAAAFNRLATAINRALDASASTTPDNEVQPVIDQANALSDKIDTQFPPTA